MPHYDDPDKWLRYRRLYSFRDLVTIRALDELRTHKVSLQHLKEANDYLRARYDEPWTTLSIQPLSGFVVYDKPETGQRVRAHGAEQQAFAFDLAPIIEDMRRKVVAFRTRGPQHIGKIERKHSIMAGEPVIAGTRIPTSAVWNFHQAGYDTAGIIRAYPTLHPEDVAKAIEFEREQQRQRDDRRHGKSA